MNRHVTGKSDRVWPMGLGITSQTRSGQSEGRPEAWALAEGDAFGLDPGSRGIEDRETACPSVLLRIEPACDTSRDSGGTVFGGQGLSPGALSIVRWRVGSVAPSPTGRS